ncbi:MAG: hypothetical protein BroJett040_06070 [Oligoflexia bacterium]|nr:MAG: hypothetical protein BroJett040_06070 [Oligoflexia bacterium]
MNILTHFSEEHRQIAQGLTVLNVICNQMLKKNSPSQADMENLFYFFRTFVEENHHGSEEDILFNKAGDLDMVREGGPMCTAFMGHRMEFDLVGRASHRLQGYQYSTTEKSKKDILQKLYTKNHPLIMPLEEHLISTDLLNALEKEKDPEKFYMLAQDYISITESHSRKEDECLFVLLSQLFTLAQLEQMYQEYLERKNRPDGRVEKALQILNELSLKYKRS